MDILTAVVNIHYLPGEVRWRGYAYIIVVLPWGFPPDRAAIWIPRLRLNVRWLCAWRTPWITVQWCTPAALRAAQQWRSACPP
jgi:hypothetical protein